MAVNVIWKSPPAVTTITSVDHGAGSNGSILTATEVGVSHDATNPITNCKFYVAEKSGTYSGDLGATVDFNEILTWGNGMNVAGFGGLQVNMNQIGGYPSVHWPTFTIPQPAYGSAFFAGVGDSASNGILLKTTMNANMLFDGIIPSGEEAKFQIRVQIPTVAATPGVRQFEQKLRYTFTS